MASVTDDMKFETQMLMGLHDIKRHYETGDISIDLIPTKQMLEMDCQATPLNSSIQVTFRFSKSE